jgi:argininosuccinate synthase
VQVVLAYSGGLDTSVILKWLQDTYDCEVVTFTADLGQVGWLQTPCLSSSTHSWVPVRCTIDMARQTLT